MVVIITALKTLETVTELAKKMTVFNVVLNSKMAWDTVPEVAI